jgi:hypothetical protein
MIEYEHYAIVSNDTNEILWTVSIEPGTLTPAPQGMRAERCKRGVKRGQVWNPTEHAAETED